MSIDSYQQPHMNKPSSNFGNTPLESRGVPAPGGPLYSRNSAQMSAVRGGHVSRTVGGFATKSSMRPGIPSKPESCAVPVGGSSAVRPSVPTHNGVSKRGGSRPGACLAASSSPALSDSQLSGENAPHTEDNNVLPSSSLFVDAPASLDELEDSFVGKCLDNRYDIVKHLASGGMGEIYLARQRGVGQDVVVKKLHEPYYQNKKVVERFIDEARSYAKITHPNAVKLHDLLNVGGQICIIMEYVHGRTLTSYIDQGYVFSIRQILDIAIQIADAVGTVHKAGIIHRDLKSQNIMLVETVGERFSVKILDFGIAKIQDKPQTDRTQEGVIVGSPQYMSPEQCYGRPVDGRVDIYAVGILLYLMVCGHLPYEAETAMELLQLQIQAEVPPVVRPDRSAVPDGLVAIIKKCLEKDPNNRYSTFAELIVDITALQEGRPLRFAQSGKERVNNVMSQIARAEHELELDKPQDSVVDTGETKVTVRPAESEINAEARANSVIPKPAMPPRPPQAPKPPQVPVQMQAQMAKPPQAPASLPQVAKVPQQVSAPIPQPPARVSAPIPQPPAQVSAPIPQPPAQVSAPIPQPPAQVSAPISQPPAQPSSPMQMPMAQVVAGQGKMAESKQQAALAPAAVSASQAGISGQRHAVRTREQQAQQKRTATRLKISIVITAFILLGLAGFGAFILIKKNQGQGNLDLNFDFTEQTLLVTELEESLNQSFTEYQESAVQNALLFSERMMDIGYPENACACLDMIPEDMMNDVAQERRNANMSRCRQYVGMLETARKNQESGKCSQTLQLLGILPESAAGMKQKLEELSVCEQAKEGRRPSGSPSPRTGEWVARNAQPSERAESVAESNGAAAGAGLVPSGAAPESEAVRKPEAEAAAQPDEPKTEVVVVPSDRPKPRQDDVDSSDSTEAEAQPSTAQKEAADDAGDIDLEETPQAAAPPEPPKPVLNVHAYPPPNMEAFKRQLYILNKKLPERCDFDKKSFIARIQFSPEVKRAKASYQKSVAGNEPPPCVIIQINTYKDFPAFSGEPFELDYVFKF